MTRIIATARTRLSNPVFLAAAASLFVVSGCDVEDEKDEEAMWDGPQSGLDDIERGLTLQNGLELNNGLMFSNGLMLSNGFMLSNGLATNGLMLSNGLMYSNGLRPTDGYMGNAAGRTFVKYLVECALPQGDSLTKNGYTFYGKVGLAPEWKTGSCGQGCQEWVSACLLARTNEFGVHVNIDMRANNPAVGTRQGSSNFTEQEGAFWGNLFVNPPQAFSCMGDNWANGYYSNRTCTTGRCAIRQVDYQSCFQGCNETTDGAYVACWNSWYGNTYSGRIITTFLKPYWMN